MRALSTQEDYRKFLHQFYQNFTSSGGDKWDIWAPMCPDHYL